MVFNLFWMSRSAWALVALKWLPALNIQLKMLSLVFRDLHICVFTSDLCTHRYQFIPHSCLVFLSVLLHHQTQFSVVIANLTVNSGSKGSFEEWVDNLKINIQILRMRNATLSSKCRPELVCLQFALAFYFAFTKYWWQRKLHLLLL